MNSIPRFLCSFDAPRVSSLFLRRIYRLLGCLSGGLRKICLYCMPRLLAVQTAFMFTTPRRTLYPQRSLASLAFAHAHAHARPLFFSFSWCACRELRRVMLGPRVPTFVPNQFHYIDLVHTSAQNHGCTGGWRSALVLVWLNEP